MTLIRKINNVYVPPLLSIWIILCLFGFILLFIHTNEWMRLGGILAMILGKLSLLTQVFLWAKEEL